MYKIDYENTIGTKVNDNGIHYMLARMAASITWEPYKKTFNYLRKMEVQEQINTINLSIL